MGSIPFSRRSVLVATLLLIIVASAVPLEAVAKSREAERVDAKITITDGAPIDFGTSWDDASGGFHMRNFVSIDEVSGDISGISTTTENVDVEVLDGCQGEECPVRVSVWGSIEVTDEAGWWEGRWVQILSFFSEDEYDLGFLALHGRGGNAGTSFVGRIVDVDDQGGTVEGMLHTMAAPARAINLSATLCVDGNNWNGAYVGSGAILGGGSASGEFVSAVSDLSHDSNLYGLLEIQDGSGSATLEFVGGGREIEGGESSFRHTFGNFVVTGGTGSFAGLFGEGRVVGAIVEMPSCSSGIGARLQFVGTGHLG